MQQTNTLLKLRREEMKKDIKVEVKYTEGYQTRFTEACLQVIEKRKYKPSQPIDSQKRSTG